MTEAVATRRRLTVILNATSVEHAVTVAALIAGHYRVAAGSTVEDDRQNPGPELDDVGDAVRCRLYAEKVGEAGVE